MMHPIDIAPLQDEEHLSPPSGQGSGLWAIVALLLIVALVVVATIAFSGQGAGEPGQPAPTEAPLNPGT